MKNSVKIIILIFISLFSLSSCMSTGSYEGAYRNGKYHGHGTLTFNDGQKYIGQFEYGKRNGYGTNFFQVVKSILDIGKMTKEMDQAQIISAMATNMKVIGKMIDMMA